MTQRDIPESHSAILYFLEQAYNRRMSARDAFKALGHALAGQNVHFPSDRPLKRLRIERLLSEGVSASLVAVRLGVSLRYVFRVKSLMKSAPSSVHTR